MHGPTWLAADPTELELCYDSLWKVFSTPDLQRAYRGFAQPAAPQRPATAHPQHRWEPPPEQVDRFVPPEWRHPPPARAAYKPDTLLRSSFTRQPLSERPSSACAVMSTQTRLPDQSSNKPGGTGAQLQNLRKPMIRGVRMGTQPRPSFGSSNGFPGPSVYRAESSRHASTSFHPLCHKTPARHSFPLAPRFSKFI